MNFWNNKRRIIFFFVCFLFLLNIAAWEEVFALSRPQNLAVDFLDVGQGDSIFILTPGDKQILIDGGPDSGVLEKINGRMPFWDRKIDIVFLSHPEKDHMQGLIEVLKRYKADYIIWTGIKRNSPEYYEWENILAKQKILGAKIIIFKEGDEAKAGGAVFKSLYPKENLSGTEFKDTSNDAGLVLKLIFGEKSFIFTGDISAKAEKEISKKGADSDVLKVAHHGSKYSTSEEFLVKTSPEIAVISDGKNNPYGHPTQEVLQRLSKFDVKTLRTDQNGDIQFTSDGANISLVNK